MRKIFLMKKGAMLLFAALLTIAIFSGCDRFGGGSEAQAGQDQAGAEGRGGNGGEGQNAEQESVFAVSTTEAVQGQIKDYIEVNGDVVTKTKVDTFPDTAGKLSKLYVEVGDRVRKDQVIAEVDPSKPGMQFSASPVKAPISGTITSLPVQIGSTVSPQMPVAQISKMDDLEVRVHVAERFISKMAVGLAAEIRFEAYPSRKFTGRVREISPVVDPMSRTLELKISISNGADVLRAGMFGEVKLITEEKSKVVKIPAECLVRRFGEDFVFVVKRGGNAGGGETTAEESSADAEDGSDRVSGIAERRKVSTGIEIDQKLEIQSGLAPGEEVVYRGQTLLEEGSKVRVVEMVQPLSEADQLQ